MWFGDKELLSLLNEFRALMFFVRFIEKMMIREDEEGIVKLDSSVILAFRLHVLNYFNLATTQSSILTATGSF